MKHKHYEMIVAKAENPDLVQFYYSGGSWFECGFDDGQITFHESSVYFLCLPQHKEACLHWLNSGEIQYNTSLVPVFQDYQPDIKFRLGSIFMQEDFNIRIKPRKEKRWIGYCANTNQTFPHPQPSREVAEDFAARSYGYTLDKWQFIEIEVEV